MELDDLKNTWNSQESKLNQPHLTPQAIIDMTQKKHQSNLRKIRIPEIAGIIICLAGAVFISVQFRQLNTLSLKIAGVLSVMLLLSVSIISYLSFCQLLMPATLTQSYQAALDQFAHQRLKFVRFQKWNILLCYLLLVSTIILLSHFMNGKDLSTNQYFWTTSFTFGYVFLRGMSRLVNRYYKNTLQASEEILLEMKDQA